MKPLPPEALAELQEATQSTARPGPHTALLESRGLVASGISRFGGWVRATDSGRQFLESKPAPRKKRGH